MNSSPKATFTRLRKSRCINKTSIRSDYSIISEPDLSTSTCNIKNTFSSSVSLPVSCTPIKQVRFNEKVRVKPIKSCANMTKNEKRAVWMQKSDTRAVRREAFATAQEIYNFEDKSQDSSYETTHWNIYESCIMEERPSLNDTVLLGCWIRGESEWRGLEKHSMPDLAELQSRVVKSYVQTVVRMNNKSNKKYSMSSREHEEIARTARAISLPASLYAEAMGKADEDAAACLYLETVATDLTKKNNKHSKNTTRRVNFQKENEKKKVRKDEGENKIVANTA